MSHNTEIYVMGAGGHAKVVTCLLRDLGYKVAAVFDDNPQLEKTFLSGIPVIGPMDRIDEHPCRQTVIAIGDNVTRRRIAERYDLPWLSVIHPRALVDPSVQLGRGVVVLAQAVVQVDSVLGDHVIVNHAATVDHDCVVENYAHLAPGVHLAGNVTVREGTLMGVGAVAIPGVRIGAGAIVGAGAAVVSDLPNHVIAMGVPAKIIKPPPRAIPWINARNRLDSEMVSVQE